MPVNNPIVSGSFRDPSGFVFRRGGILYRQVNKSYKDNYDLLMSSGLYRELTEKGLLVAHREIDAPPVQKEIAYKVIQPDPVPFVSYPYEWCFSQLKDAALATLEIQKIALQFGMVLKDASAFNILFIGCRPVFIDSLSFEAYEKGLPWVAYRQFCQHFFSPVALMSMKDLSLGRLLSIFLDGIPLDLTSKLLPVRSRFKMSVLTHIHLHAKAQSKYQGKAMRPEHKGRVSKMGLLGIIDSLESSIRKMALKKGKTVWGDYYNATNYSTESFDHKKAIVDGFIKRAAPRNLWDLGANTGMFSKIASENKVQTVSFDSDPIAIERMYLECRNVKENKILPLMMDLTNPSAAIGWASHERMSFVERGPVDMVMALALIHHLAIGNNVPIESIAEFFGRLCRFLIIEFVPKQDSQVQHMLASREDIFNKYTIEVFEHEFSRLFNIIDTVNVKDSARTMYLMENRSYQ